METKLSGATSQSILLKILDSTSTTGAGKTGLVFNTASLVAYYSRNGVAATAISLVTQTVTGAWTSGGFVEIDATHAPGLYRLDVPDAALAYASGVTTVVISMNGATGMAQMDKEIELARKRFAISSVGVSAGGGSTSSQTVPSAEKTLPKVGHVYFVPSLGEARFITGYNAGTGVATFTTAFASDPSGLDYITYVVAPGESVLPVPATLNASLTAPSAIISATPTGDQTLAYLGQLARNKLTEDGANQKLYADDGTTLVATYATTVSGGTVTRGKGA